MTEQIAYRYRVEFESVSTIDHPSMYDQRTVEVIPEDWWYPTVREHDSEEQARAQYDGLRQLIEKGEWIRNVRLLRSPVPDWEPAP